MVVILQIAVMQNWKRQKKMSNKLYRGVRQGTEAKVYVDNAELSLEPSKQLHPSNATPEWSYAGDGPSQLALAILLDALDTFPNKNEMALKYYHAFKNEFIAVADYQTGFTILQSQVKEWLFNQIVKKTDNPGGWVI